jgi:hypothetical protein
MKGNVLTELSGCEFVENITFKLLAISNTI